MASTYTPNLGFTLPTTGELAGTWGDTVNVGITTLIDSAIAGTTTLAADADVTLSTTTGAANQARSAVILWTASNGATTRFVTAPASTKAYIVVNAGTGPVVLRGVGPTTGVTVATGTRALVAWNGTDFVKVSSSTVALASEVTGTLPITSGGTGATTAVTALASLGERTSGTGSTILPAGTTAERDGTPLAGYIRWNSTLNQYEGYTGSAWSAIGGGATGAPGNPVFIENDQTVTGDYTLSAGKNAGTFGPVSINSGVTVTVPSNAVWSIV